MYFLQEKIQGSSSIISKDGKIFVICDKYGKITYYENIKSEYNNIIFKTSFHAPFKNTTAHVTMKLSNSKQILALIDPNEQVIYLYKIIQQKITNIAALLISSTEIEFSNDNRILFAAVNGSVLMYDISIKKPEIIGSLNGFVGQVHLTIDFNDKVIVGEKHTGKIIYHEKTGFDWLSLHEIGSRRMDIQNSNELKIMKSVTMVKESKTNRIYVQTDKKQYILYGHEADLTDNGIFIAINKKIVFYSIQNGIIKENPTFSIIPPEPVMHITTNKDANTILLTTNNGNVFVYCKKN